MKLTSADQVSAETISEIVKHAVSIFLRRRRRYLLIHNKPVRVRTLGCIFTHLHHFGMDVEAGVTQLSDLLGQELHPLGGVTEDNRLVDLKLLNGKKKRKVRAQ